MIGRIPGGLLSLALGALLPASAAAQVVQYYHLDALGTVRAVTDAAGQVVERHDYLPFGEEWCPGPPPGVCGPVPPGEPKRFTGKERDTETGFDYFGARYYGSRVGRFTTVDPAYVVSANLVDPQLWNRYSYVRNNPLRHTDPDGRLVDIVVDIAAIEYDLLDIGVTLYTGGDLTRTHFKALGGDVLGAAIPFLVGVGAAIRAANKVDNAIDVGKGTNNVIDAGRAKGVAKEGRYEFPDQRAGKIPYVGESENIARRLGDHKRTGRLQAGTEKTTEVLGGKEARQIAEHKRIQEITGGVPARKSDRVSNRVDPIGPKRKQLLKE